MSNVNKIIRMRAEISDDASTETAGTINDTEQWPVNRSITSTVLW
jgi:hypothetical protein